MNELLKLTSREINSANSILRRFQENFEKDPSSTFHGCDDAMKAAAEIEVWKAIEKFEQNGHTVAAIAAWLQRQALSDARHPSFSTSATSNLMHRFRTAAFAKAAEELQDIVKYEAKMAA